MQSHTKLMNERPEHFVFNGSIQGLQKASLTVRTGEMAHIFFGVGGPNCISAVHVIGEILQSTISVR